MQYVSKREKKDLRQCFKMLLTLNDDSNFGDVSDFRRYFRLQKVSDFKIFRIKTIFQTLDVVTDFGQCFRL